MPSDLLALALEIARDTVDYLLWGWWLLPVWALAARVGLFAVSRPARWRADATGPVPRRLAAAALLGFARPVSRTELSENLAALGGAPLPTALYLAAGHGLTVYYLFLLGPLLGKDVLLSHLLGGALFVILAAVFARALGVGSERAERRPGRDEGWAKAGVGEAGRFLARAGWGLALGGLVGAWGLLRPGLEPALLVGSPVGAQATNALLGVAVSFTAGMAPVANLFLGTYLWKAGLAHAGLVAFFWASPASPQRVLLYRRLWGSRRAGCWSAALLLSALGSGLLTALLFRLAGWTIHYKLIPEQLWTG